MTGRARDDEFFVGWQGRVSRRLGRFLWGVAICLVAGLVVLAVGLGSRAHDPAGPGFAPGPDVAVPEGEQSFTGVLVAGPYPLLRLAPDAAHPRGRTLLLSGEGKRGMPGAVADLAGKLVEAQGYLTRRGSIAMLVLDDTPRALAEAPPPPPAAEPLGRWRITGEICDGKCAAGVMRPGTGIAHRACAALCLDGDIPAVFVSTAPVAGSTVLLLADASGGRPSAALVALAGVRLRLDGAVERQGDMLVFRADPATLSAP
jgi:hypothetical protein